MHGLLGWKPENVLDWLLSDPDGPEDRSEQEENLAHTFSTVAVPRIPVGLRRSTAIRSVKT